MCTVLLVSMTDSDDWKAWFTKALPDGSTATADGYAARSKASRANTRSIAVAALVRVC